MSLTQSHAPTEALNDHRSEPDPLVLWRDGSGAEHETPVWLTPTSAIVERAEQIETLPRVEAYHLTELDIFVDELGFGDRQDVHPSDEATVQRIYRQSERRFEREDEA